MKTVRLHRIAAHFPGAGSFVRKAHPACPGKP
jgi:hypothetical protein